MAEKPGVESPVIDYGTPPSGRGREVMLGIFLGLGAAVVLVVGSAFVGAAIDAKVNEGQELAGLGGLIVGGLVGFGLVLVAALLGLRLGRRRGNARLRGIGQGLMISLGLGALWLGVCALSGLA
jgi:hypothetical protein